MLIEDIIKKEFPDLIKEHPSPYSLQHVIKSIYSNKTKQIDFKNFIDKNTNFLVTFDGVNFVFNQISVPLVDKHLPLEKLVEQELEETFWHHIHDSEGIFRLDKKDFPTLFDEVIAPSNKDNPEFYDGEMITYSFDSFADTFISNYSFGRFWDRDNFIDIKDIDRIIETDDIPETVVDQLDKELSLLKGIAEKQIKEMGEYYTWYRKSSEEKIDEVNHLNECLESNTLTFHLPHSTFEPIFTQMYNEIHQSKKFDKK